MAETPFAPQFTLLPTGNVGIGTTAPSQKLHVDGNVKAKRVITGDIVFADNASGKNLWRVYQDKKGLCLRNIETGKSYRIMLEEIK